MSVQPDRQEFDPQAELDVVAGESVEAIRTAYRRLAGTYHAGTGAHADHQRMVRLNRAYALLSDPPRRAAYDAGRRPVARRPAAPGRHHAAR
jgi:molecular chaperone DnaJ